MKIVQLDNIGEICKGLGLECSIDCETTGLYWAKDHKLFSVIISDATEDYYFNFHAYPEEGVIPLPRACLDYIATLATDPARTWWMQNAKFDMHMLAREGIFFEGKIYDLQFLDRVHNNQHKSYSLKEISKRWGDEKLDIAWTYIEENKLFEESICSITGKEWKRPCFEKVPFKIMSEYGCQDGRATLDVGKKILASIREMDAELLPNIPKQENIVENEARLVHTLFNMEHTGVKINREYCLEAFHYYKGLTEEVAEKFKSMTGEDFVKGTLTFEKVFLSEQDKWEKTEKDNWRWDAKHMACFDNPAARLVVEYSEAKKQMEYFENFLFFSSSKDVVHPNFKQAGTVTGRMSSSDPNFQNLTNPDKYEGEKDASKYPVRSAFIPREDYVFVMVDFEQVEYRVFLDRARANGLIHEVLGGLDVHAATAKIAGVTRKEAKTVNFLTLYGGGPAKLAAGLYEMKGTAKQHQAVYMHMLNWNISDEQKQIFAEMSLDLKGHITPLIRKAWDIQKQIFKAAPEIKDTIKSIQKTAETRKYIFNKYGRRCRYEDKKWAYKASNHLIQGECADLLKFAMNKIDDVLKDTRSKMLLQIHDELVFEIHKEELWIIHDIKKIMESIYPHKTLPLLVDIEYSEKNLADKLPWPGQKFHSEAARNEVKRGSSETLAGHA